MNEKAAKRETAEAVFWELLFYTAMILMVGRAFLHTSQVMFLWNEILHGKFISYSLWVQLFTATVVVGKSIREKRFTLWEAFIVMAAMIAFGRSYEMTGYEELPGILMLMIGAKGIPAKRLAAVFFVLTASLTGVVLYLSHIGRVSNWIFYGEGARWKESLGFLYPNEFAAHVFFLFLMWALVRGGSITFVEMAAMGAAVWIVWVKSSPRTFLLCSAALLVVLMCAKLSQHSQGVRKIFRSRVVGILLMIIPFAIAAFALYLAKEFHPSIDWIVKLNKLLTNRIELGAAALRDYGVKLFGQDMEMIGVTYRGNGEGYNFLDCSYVNILVRYGLAPFAMTMFLFLVQGIRAVKRRDSFYLALLCLLAVQGFMEHHLIDFAYHPFFMLTLAAWPQPKRRSDGSEDLKSDDLFPEAEPVPVIPDEGEDLPEEEIFNALSGKGTSEEAPAAAAEEIPEEPVPEEAAVEAAIPEEEPFAAPDEEAEEDRLAEEVEEALREETAEEEKRAAEAGPSSGAPAEEEQ